ncbi:uncharacterized protein LOC108253823 [Diaphorina citri]|uniref:Uncharacterized protein LOC108253823 n=1 Tax=Diaphorina citri TaxID=121845 RepID=A0A1S4EP77_DIACI|nr:uncharacterized protein LOC108253823 [Diaphorina citri]
MAYTQPILDYGCSIFMNANKKYLSHLDTIHHMGIRLISRALKSSPVNSLYAESAILPLSVRRRLLFSNIIAKVSADQTNPLFNILFNNYHLNKFEADDINITYKNQPLIYYYQKQNPLYIYPNKIIPIQIVVPPWIIPSPDVNYLINDKKSNISCIEIKNKYLEILQIYTDFTLCFTDGSKTDSNTGFAFIINNENFQYRLPHEASIFTAEALAIFYCIKKISDMKIKKAIIFSDNKSVLNGIDNIQQRNNIIQLIKQEYYFASTNGSQISFMWIPSHSNIALNDKADQLAKNSINSKLLDFYIQDDLKNHLRKNIVKLYNDQWTNIQNNKLRTIKDNTTLWKTSLRKIRNEEILLTRLRIGHTRITHSYLFTKTPHPICTCGFPLTVKHIFECNKYKKFREKLSLPSIEIALSDNENMAEKTIKYMKMINLYSKV